MLCLSVSVCVYGACANGLMFMGLYICIRIRLREGGERVLCVLVSNIKIHLIVVILRIADIPCSIVVYILFVSVFIVQSLLICSSV